MGIHSVCQSMTVGSYQSGMLQAGLHPLLKWIRFVVSEEPPPLGNMTIYNRENNIVLFEMGNVTLEERYQIIS